jgi:pyruvate dehydrogenase (quinone)
LVKVIAESRHEMSRADDPVDHKRDDAASQDGVEHAMRNQPYIMIPKEVAKGLGRRQVWRLAAAGAVLSSAPRLASAAPASEAAADLASQPRPDFTGDPDTSDVIIETLMQWGVSHVFGVVGDGINPLIEALRKRRDRIAFIPTRHEEAAAFMACGFAKHTGRLGVCVATTGPGAVHLMNGLYDAKFDGAPVLALTGQTFHDLSGVRYQQDLDTIRLMQEVALYNVEVSGPQHAIIVANRACRAALGDRGVAHLTIAKDVQMMKLSADKRSMRNPGARTSSSWVPAAPAAGGEQLQGAADILNAGKRVAVLCGQGALGARDEVIQLADTLGAPVAKALLGKAVLPDDSPFTTGGIGDLGTAPSSWSMKSCDTVLILGSTMPWEEYYPTPGQARGVQVDIKPDRLGLRYPVEVGLAGDVKGTLRGLLPLLHRKTDRGFLTEAQQRMAEWNGLLDAVESTARSPLRPQMVIRALSDLMEDTAVISLDCGANTHFAARCIRLRENQRISGTGMLATMAPGMSYAIAARLAYPDRQSVAIVGDGGFAMLMAELSTAVAHNLPIKIILLKNNALAEVMFEQREIGYPNYGCELAPIDFVAFAKACGADGFRCERPEEIRPAIQAALASPKPAVVEAVVDPEEKPSRPDELRA